MVKKYCLLFILIINFLSTNPRTRSAIKIDNDNGKIEMQNVYDIKTADKSIKTNVTCGGNLSN